MTKYILHGGETSRKSESNKRFFAAMTSGWSGKVNILCVYFARPKELWPKLFTQDWINFTKNSSGKSLNLVCGDDKVPVFINQVRKANVIYLRGGDTRRLKQALKKTKDFNQLLKSKVVSGSSAGAQVLAKYYYSNDRNRIEQGLGILPLKVFCHYCQEKAVKLKKLKEFGENVKAVYAIPEEKFFVIKD